MNPSTLAKIEIRKNQKDLRLKKSEQDCKGRKKKQNATKR
jgi:hypothetical protein